MKGQPGIHRDACRVQKRLNIVNAKLYQNSTYYYPHSWVNFVPNSVFALGEL